MNAMGTRGAWVWGVLIALLVGLSPPIARADSRPNAALRYWPAIERYRFHEANCGYPLVSALYTDPESSTVEEIAVARAFVEGPAQQHVTAFIAASTIPECDWGIDEAEGPGGLLPHIGHLRAIGQLLCADAALKLEAGEPAAAAERYAAMLRVARHARGQDRFLICGLVEAALVHLTIKQVNIALDEDAFEPEQKALLLATLDLFDRADPHGLRAGIIGERDMMAGWIRRVYVPGQAVTQEMREIGAMLVGSDKSPAAQQLLRLHERGDPIEPYVRLLEGAYDAMLAAWDGPDPQAALTRLAEATKDGTYGPLSAIMVWDASRTRGTHDDAVRKLAVLRERLAD